MQLKWKAFLRNHKMLATDFHIMDRKISMGYWEKITIQIFWHATCHTFFLILWRYVVFLNDITNQTISENIKKYANSNTKNTCTRKYTTLMWCFYMIEKVEELWLKLIIRKQKKWFSKHPTMFNTIHDWAFYLICHH